MLMWPKIKMFETVSKSMMTARRLDEVDLHAPVAASRHPICYELMREQALGYHLYLAGSG